MTLGMTPSSDKTLVIKHIQNSTQEQENLYATCKWSLYTHLTVL